MYSAYGDGMSLAIFANPGFSLFSVFVQISSQAK